MSDSTNPPIRFLALGDSYTFGQSVSTADRWSVQLSEQIKVAAPGKDVQLDIIAGNGWTTNELWNAIRYSQPQGPYDLVALLVGVNDQYRGGSAQQYREDFHFLLGKVIGYAGGDPQRVLVLSIPDWGVTPFAQNDPRPAAQISAEIDAFNAINKEEAQSAGVHYVDVTPISRQALSDRDLTAFDGLHPSGKMYAAWASLALPEALAALGIK
jgi:lysophospholipase L1-like esterase